MLKFKINLSKKKNSENIYGSEKSLYQPLSIIGSRNMNTKISIITLILILCCSTAFAANNRRKGPPKKTNYYLRSTMGYGLFHKNATPSITGAVAEEVFDTTFSAGLGYDYSEKFSFESGYLSLGKSSTKAITQQGPIDLTTSSYTEQSTTIFTEDTGYYLEMHMIVPNASTLGIYLKVGILSWESEVDSTVFEKNMPLGTNQTISSHSSNIFKDEDFYYGVGVDFLVNSKFTISQEWNHYKVNGEVIDVISAALKYKFGK
jgi:hypothetical protein